jgi:magnesium-protoporphyrin O-methyltransferase
MTCRHCVDSADLFGESRARYELKRFRRRGPSRSTRLLLRGIRVQGLRDFDLLDIGGGVGAIQHELLSDGARRATAVDASTAYLDAARREAVRRGTEDRVTFLSGDAVELAEDLPAAEVVTLDRVLCCYPDLPSLVAVSAERAREVWGVVVPRETWWVRAGVGILNLVEALRRKAFRVYLHGVDRIRDEAAVHGLAEVFRDRTFLWEVRVFRRAAPQSGAGKP